MKPRRSAGRIRGGETRVKLRARRLTDEEVAIYDVLPASLARKVVVVELPALPGPIAGLTIGTVVFHKGELDPDRPTALMAHELVHVRQFHDEGFIGFNLRYNSAFLRDLVAHRRWAQAYRRIPAEIEARTEARRWLDRSLANDGTTSV